MRKVLWQGGLEVGNWAEFRQRVLGHLNAKSFMGKEVWRLEN